MIASLADGSEIEVLTHPIVLEQGDAIKLKQDR